ncbi:MAG: hypothetical protein KJ737_16715 [Proteobacteria bacterium]|nr:hypothetical protein [Pseudomonadota bacterium]
MIEKKIVVLLPKYIGDSIMATPALRLIEKAYPHASISVICRQINKEIFDRTQYHAITDPRCLDKKKGTFQLINMLRRGKFVTSQKVCGRKDATMPRQ